MPKVVAILHPAAILRGRFTDEPAQIAYLRRWIKVAKTTPGWKPVDVDKLPPRSRVFPSPAALREFHQQLQQMEEPAVSIDTEEAGVYLICVGLTQLDLATGEVGSSLNLPIRLKGGRQAWDPQTLEKLVVEFGAILEDEKIAKVFHNGVTHDVPILKEIGFEVRGDLYDTMVLSHLLYPEFRKGLQFAATLWCGAPRWKQLVKDEDELEEKG